MYSCYNHDHYRRIIITTVSILIVTVVTSITLTEPFLLIIGRWIERCGIAKFVDSEIEALNDLKSMVIRSSAYNGRVMKERKKEKAKPDYY